jgi:hypothetical protein
MNTIEMRVYLRRQYSFYFYFVYISGQDIFSIKIITPEK